MMQHSSAGSNRKTETIYVSQFANIKKVSMAVDRNIGIVGLRMQSASGEYVVDKNWSGMPS